MTGRLILYSWFYLYCIAIHYFLQIILHYRLLQIMSIILCAIQCFLVAYLFYTFQFQFSRSLHVRLFATPWTAAHQTSLSITSSQTLLKLMSIKLVKTSNHLILCHPLLLLPSVFPSSRVFFNKSVLHIMWTKYGSFNFSMSPSSEYSGPVSCRIDWFDLLAVQGTLNSSPTSQFKSNQFFGPLLSLWFSSHTHTWLQGKP